MGWNWMPLSLSFSGGSFLDYSNNNILTQGFFWGGVV